MESNEHHWASFDSSPQFPYTMSLFDLPDLSFSNDASMWSPHTQESTDTWVDTTETPLASLDSNTADNFGLDQGPQWRFSNGPCSNSFIEDYALDTLPEWAELDPSGVSGVFPDSSSTESQGPNPWGSISVQSPCSGSQYSNSCAPFLSLSLCSESLLFSPTSSELLHAPPTLCNTPALSKITKEDFISPIGNHIQGPFPSEAETHPVPGTPERRPNKSHGQQTSPPRPKAREVRKKERPERCPVCKKGHQYISLMKRHIRSKHPDYAVEHGIAKRPNICERCGKRYARSDHLYRHGIKIHGWTPKRSIRP